ncbi:MAG: hypothetical protein HC778_06770 [Chamaesiphon sp. CSU_1_12]|nr:hypothetical protein [Chamaesiphon sp. CSU_1_12]
MNIASAILLSAIGIGVNDRLFLPIGYISSFIATCLWIWYRCDRVNIDLKQVIGKPDRGVQWLRVIGLTFVGLIFSLASFLVILGLISYIFPNFAEQILTVVSKKQKHSHKFWRYATISHFEFYDDSCGGTNI